MLILALAFTRFNRPPLDGCEQNQILTEFFPLESADMVECRNNPKTDFNGIADEQSGALTGKETKMKTAKVKGITSQQAFIYCRVSSQAQVEEGHGLESQETRCREYATRKGYEVTQTFYEKAVSGGVANRPSFNAMLEFLRKSGGARYCGCY